MLLTTIRTFAVYFLLFFQFSDLQQRGGNVWVSKDIILLYNYTTLIVKKFRCKYSFSTRNKNITGHQKIIRFSWRKERGLLKIEYVLLTLFCGTLNYYHHLTYLLVNDIAIVFYSIIHLRIFSTRGLNYKCTMFNIATMRFMQPSYMPTSFQ
jgi:hypothetical protein